MSRTRHAGYDAPRPGGVRTLSWEYPDGWQVPEHTHRSHQLVYATGGVMSVHAGDGTWVVPTTWAVWIPAGVVHAIDIAGAVSMRTLYVASDLGAGLPRTCRVVAVTPLVRELILHAVARGELVGRRAADRRLVGVLCDQLRALPAAPMYLPGTRDPRATRVAQRLRADPAEPATLHVLARTAGGSARTLQRAFVRDTGMTFARWRQQLRFLEALRRLAEGAKVTAVALDVGYQSPSAFVAAFRRQLGTSPARYLVDATAP